MATSAITTRVTKAERKLLERKRMTAAFIIIMMATSTAFTVNSMLDISLMHSALQGRCIMEMNKALNETMAMDTMNFNRSCPILLENYNTSPPVKLFLAFLFIGAFVRTQMGTFLFAEAQFGVKNLKGYMVFTGLVIMTFTVVVTCEMLYTHYPWTDEMKADDTKYFDEVRFHAGGLKWIFRHCLLDTLMTAVYAFFMIVLRNPEP